MNIDTRLFKGLGIGLIGDFGETWTHAALRDIIEAHGGKNFSQIVSGLTHIVCDRKTWQEGIFETLARHSPHIHFVSITWLLDSIADQAREPERKHSMQRLDEKSDERHTLKQGVVDEAFEEKGYAEQFQEGVEMAMRELGSDNYHWYRDDTGFNFSVNVTRTLDKQIEMFTLSLFETNDGPPFFYACTASFKTHWMLSEGYFHESSPETTVLARFGSSFHNAFYAWRMMFRCLTGTDWEFRHWVLPNVEADDHGSCHFVPGTALRPLMPECATQHQEHWADVQRRTEAPVKRAITTALTGIFKRTKPTPVPRSALKRAPSKPRPDERGTWNARTGSFRKRVRIRLTPESSSDDDREPVSDDDDRSLVGITTQYFVYAMPRAGEPAGEITMEMTGRAWFGAREVARTRCEDYERAARMVKRPAHVPWMPDPPSPGPIVVRVGGGRVRYWDWEMLKKGFQGSY